MTVDEAHESSLSELYRGEADIRLASLRRLLMGVAYEIEEYLNEDEHSHRRRSPTNDVLVLDDELCLLEHFINTIRAKR